MKRRLTAAALPLVLLVMATPVEAGGCWPGPGCSPWKINFGANIYVNAQQQQAGPWYLYWPMEAHFAVPAPTGYPYWPNPMTLPTQGGGLGLGGAVPAPAGPILSPTPGTFTPPAPTPVPPVKQSTFQPAGYNVPSYWYGR
jgi:hypothetical protein